MGTAATGRSRVELHAASRPLRDYLATGSQSLEVVVHEHPSDPEPCGELRRRHAPASVDLLEQLLRTTAARPALVPGREVDPAPAGATRANETCTPKGPKMESQDPELHGESTRKGPEMDARMRFNVLVELPSPRKVECEVGVHLSSNDPSLDG